MEKGESSGKIPCAPVKIPSGQPIEKTMSVTKIIGISLTSMISCYLIFPQTTTTLYNNYVRDKTSKKASVLTAPETLYGRTKAVVKQISNPAKEVAFYRNVGLFGAAVYLLSTQGHQFTVMAK